MYPRDAGLDSGNPLWIFIKNLIILSFLSVPFIAFPPSQPNPPNPVSCSLPLPSLLPSSSVRVVREGVCEREENFNASGLCFHLSDSIFFFNSFWSLLPIYLPPSTTVRWNRWSSMFDLYVSCFSIHHPWVFFLHLLVCFLCDRWLDDFWLCWFSRKFHFLFSISPFGMDSTQKRRKFRFFQLRFGDCFVSFGCVCRQHFFFGFL